MINPLFFLPYTRIANTNIGLIQSFSTLLCGYLGGFSDTGAGSKDGRLLTIEEVGQIMNGASIPDSSRDIQKLTQSCSF